ncbi:MAG: metalloregulator ArsR/SmtB family transcription factor [Pseudomonadota bacterium]
MSLEAVEAGADKAAAKSRGLQEIEEADAVFGALAHPLRRQILLSVHFRGEARAGEIARRFDCSWPTTSRHLATLVESGLLSVERQGRERLYRANDELLVSLFERWLGYLR